MSFRSVPLFLTSLALSRTTLVAGSSSLIEDVAALKADDECEIAGEGSCAINALQRHGKLKSSEALVTEAGCEDAKPGSVCHNEIQWAKTDGIGGHPDWYPGLTAASSDAEFQALVHSSHPTKCPVPCSLAKQAKWCQGPPPAPLHPPSADGGAVKIKVLTYNLFWWNLFRMRGGNGESAGKLIKEAGKDELFDVMGFQECEDGKRVLEKVGLLEHYEMLQGEHAVCVGYRKDKWTFIAKGLKDVAEDMKSHWYGRRGALWVRLQEKKTGRKLLFVNHHGPLEVNSGGTCGGTATAYNLINLMHDKAEPGDMIILVGDFNANSASKTVQELWKRMVMLQAGDSFGGVDNVFGNMPAASVIGVKTLGSGGSDHDAVEATVEVGNQKILEINAAAQPMSSKASEFVISNPPGDSWQKFWCGRLEPDLNYVVPEGGWSQTVEHHPQAGDSQDVASAQRCCRLCQRDSKCKSWTWKDSGPKCLLHGALPTKKTSVPGFVSGLPAAMAAKVAQENARNAISELK